MSNAHDSAPWRQWFNAHLLYTNNHPLKFYLDGYNQCEFHALTKIIEAYGGQLTVPTNQEAVVFAEPDRPIEIYYYRYNIKYIYDCIVANKKIEDIKKYLIPTVPNGYNLAHVEQLNQLPSGPQSTSSTFDPNGSQTQLFAARTSTVIDHTSPNTSPDDKTSTPSVNAEVSSSIKMDSILISDSDDEVHHTKQMTTEVSELNPIVQTHEQPPKRICRAIGISKSPPPACFPDSTRGTTSRQTSPDDDTTAKREKVEQSSPEPSNSLHFPSTNYNGYDILSDCCRYINYANSAESESDLESTSSRLSVGRAVARKSTTRNSGVELEPGYKVRRRVRYSNEEDQKIIQYLVDNRAIADADGTAVWRKLEKARVLVDPPRTANSLLSYFSRTLLYKCERYTDDPTILAEFRKLLVKKQEQIMEQVRRSRM